METLAIGIRNAGTLAHSFSPPSLIWTTCLLRSISGKENGLDLGLSGVGTSYGSLCEDCVCLFWGMTPKYNTRRAFVFFATPSLLRD